MRLALVPDSTNFHPGAVVAEATCASNAKSSANGVSTALMLRGSSERMMPRPWLSVITALVAPVRFTKNCSSPSVSPEVSPLMVTSNVFVVSRAEKVSTARLKM